MFTIRSLFAKHLLCVFCLTIFNSFGRLRTKKVRFGVCNLESGNVFSLVRLNTVEKAGSDLGVSRSKSLDLTTLCQNLKLMPVSAIAFVCFLN